MAPNPLLEKKSINPNVLIESARALAKPYNDFVEDYVSKHPDARGLSYKAIIKMENSGKPVIWNSKTIYPESYKDNTILISKDTKTETQHKIASKNFEENRKLNEVIEVINNPYNPIGWIPGVRTVANMGISDAAHRTNNPNKYNYDLNAGISLVTDVPLITSGGLKSLVGSYTGLVGGRLIGEQYGYPELGAFIGSVAGSFSPKLISRGINYAYPKLTPKDLLLAREMDKSIKQQIFEGKYKINFNSNIPEVSIRSQEEFPFRDPSNLLLGVKTSGIHRQTTTGDITGSRNVDNPNKPGPIKYHKSRVILKEIVKPPSILKVTNANEFYPIPRGIYYPKGIDFTKEILMKLGFRPNVQRVWINPEND